MMTARGTKTLIILLAGYWLWHALVVLAATGSLDLRGYAMGTFYLENLLSLYLPPILIALLIYRRRRKTDAQN